MSDIEEYRKIGADHFAVSTVFFNPFRTLILLQQYSNNKIIIVLLFNY